MTVEDFLLKRDLTAGRLIFRYSVAERTVMGDGLTVERLALTQLVLVRIQVPQPIYYA